MSMTLKNVSGPIDESLEINGRGKSAVRPDHLMIEFDLAGAEWVVVAYLSQDPNMLAVVASGKSPHVVTGSIMSGAPEEWVEKENKLVGSKTDPVLIEKLRRQLDPPPSLKFLPRSMSIRQAGKKSNHGLNYDMRYRRFALENEMMEGEAQAIVELYRTKVYPRVFDYWHPAIRQEMKDNNRTLTNCFGRKVRLLDQWGLELFMAAYSFKPQSTVFDCVRHAMILAYGDSSPAFMPMKLGAQVHDSLMVNYPVPITIEEWQNLARFVIVMSRDYMRPQLIYNEVPFRLNCDVKLGMGWGRMRSLPVQEDIDNQVEMLRHTLSAVVEEEQKLSHPDQAIAQALEEKLEVEAAA